MGVGHVSGGPVPFLDGRVCVGVVLWSHPSLSLPVPPTNPSHPTPPPATRGLWEGTQDSRGGVSPRPLEQLNHLLPACCLRSLNLPGPSRHNNQEQWEQEENPNEKSGKVQTGARCLSRATLIVFLSTEQSAVSLMVIKDTHAGHSGDFGKKKNCVREWIGDFFS